MHIKTLNIISGITFNVTLTLTVVRLLYSCVVDQVNIETRESQQYNSVFLSLLNGTLLS